MIRRCNRLQCWWHHRLRQADRETFLAALKQQAAKRDRPRVVIAAAWEDFVRQPGQGHWQCSCAMREALQRRLDGEEMP